MKNKVKVKTKHKTFKFDSEKQCCEYFGWKVESFWARVERSKNKKFTQKCNYEVEIEIEFLEE